MKHVYTNRDGERIAADTKEQAATFHDVTLTGEDRLPDEWESDWAQVPDDHVFTVRDSDDGGEETLSAREFAAQHDEPGYVSTTYG